MSRFQRITLIVLAALLALVAVGCKSGSSAGGKEDAEKMTNVVADYFVGGFTGNRKLAQDALGRDIQRYANTVGKPVAEGITSSRTFENEMLTVVFTVPSSDASLTLNFKVSNPASGTVTMSDPSKTIASDDLDFEVSDENGAFKIKKMDPAFDATATAPPEQ